MKNRNMSFLEALSILQIEQILHLEFGNEENNKMLQKKELLYKINVEAARYFFQI